jgi:23S rRNA (uracil1939-C5)-methyltransferase
MAGTATANSCSEPAVDERLTIDRLGARADGVADTQSGAVHVPYALPGETVRAARDESGLRARLLHIETAAADRVAPFCPYFGICGGCATQHIAQASYAAWKRDIVVQTLLRAGFDAPVGPLIDAHGRGRRRITLHARFDGGMRVGYMAARSHELVEIAFCPIAEPELKESPRMAAALAERLRTSGKPLDIQITSTETGLDIDIRGHGPVSERLRQALVATAIDLDLARLSVHGDILIEQRAPLVTMGRAQVSPPPGGFLQATRAGEEILAGIVTENCGNSRRVLDLFAGCGPFSLRLAERSEVHAIDGDRGSLAALDKAARASSGLRPITTETRDLFRRPSLAPNWRVSTRWSSTRRAPAPRPRRSSWRGQRSRWRSGYPATSALLDVTP